MLDGIHNSKANSRDESPIPCNPQHLPSQLELPHQREMIDNQVDEIDYYDSDSLEEYAKLEAQCNTELQSDKKGIINVQEIQSNKVDTIIDLNSNKVEQHNIILPIDDLHSSESIAKMQQLEDELTKFKNENTALSQIKGEYEMQLKQYTKKIDDLENQKSTTIKEIEQKKDEEISRLLKQNKEYEIQLKQASLTSNKTFNQEIEQLNNELNAIKEENRIKDQSTMQVITNLKTSNKELDFQNSQLRQEIKRLEQLRLKQSPNEVSETKKSAYPKQKILNPNALLQNKQKVEPKLVKLNPLEYDMIFPSKYHDNVSKLVSEKEYEKGKIQKIFEDGKKETVFSNGSKKEVHPDGYTIVYFANKDIKQTFPDGKVVYFYSEAKTTQITYPNGVQAFKFITKQVEKHYPDNKREIL